MGWEKRFNFFNFSGIRDCNGKDGERIDGTE
jgi:hypothetical protein